jgi:CubicO group peptidase (beta-lactamase class C family)
MPEGVSLWYNTQTMKETSLLCILLIFHAINLSAQLDNLVTPAPPATALHQSNRARIFFTEKRISAETLSSKDFLTNFTLTNKSDLFFVAYFNNSLTNYKHQLLPDASADTLFKLGNYQFTLYVDNRLIYQSNLLPGAPSANSQHTDTYLNRPLIDNINGQGTWSESFWNRFLVNGGDRALTDGRHVLKMEIRPYVKAVTILAGEIMASGDLIVNVARHPEINIQNIRLSKLRPYNGLSPAADYFDTTRIKQLKAAVEAGVYKKINSIVVLKKGKILLEEYFNGDTRHTLHDTRSVGKSFSSTLTGIAIREGFIKTDTQAISNFYNLRQFQHFSAAKTTATIKDLLTMSSGFDGNDEDDHSAGNEENMYPTGDWVKFALDLPYHDSLKASWHYFTAGVILLGDILNKAIPNGLEKYADGKLFKPLGINHYKWQYTPQHVPNTAGGLQMNALDLAKYGQLYKNGGSWNGRRILTGDWVKKTFTKQRQIRNRDNEYYGYLFWNKTFKAGDKSYEAFYCAGNGGNYILVFKDQPFVIVITASAYGQYYAHAQVGQMLSDYILPAIMQ